MAAAQRFDVAVGCYIIGDPGLDDEQNKLLDAYGITSTGAVLVRPDGYIAWRTSALAADPASIITDAMSRILGRSATST